MSIMELRFIGSGDAFGSGGRFNTCFLVTGAHGRFLIDCGASSLVALKQAAIDPASIDAIVVSHLHGDHFGGLPFLLLDARLMSKRRKPLLLCGPRGFEERLRAAQETLFPGSSARPLGFALEHRVLDGGTRCDVGHFAVTPYPAVHEAGAPCYSLRIECEGKVIVYSGDTEWNDRARRRCARRRSLHLRMFKLGAAAQGPYRLSNAGAEARGADHRNARGQARDPHAYEPRYAGTPFRACARNGVRWDGRDPLTTARRR